MKYEVFVTAYTNYKYTVEADNYEDAIDKGEAMYKNDVLLNVDTSEEQTRDATPFEIQTGYKIKI